jgi:hypothetical protein
VLWEIGQKDVIFINPTERDYRQYDHILPLVSYRPEVKIKGDAYITADYSFEGATQFPLYLTVSGIDQNNKPVEIEYFLQKNKSIKIHDIQILKMNLSFRLEDGAGAIPGLCVINKFQINSFSKVTTYRPKSTRFQVTLDKAPISQGDFVWRAPQSHFNASIHNDETFQVVKSFSVEKKIYGSAVIRFDLDAIQDGLAYVLRVRGRNEAGYFEKLFPLSRSGGIPISDMALIGLDIAVKGELVSKKGKHISNPIPIKINQLDVQYLNKQNMRQNSSSRPVNFSNRSIESFSSRATYFNPALNMDRPEIATARSMADSLDTTLSYAQIIEGGKDMFWPKVFLAKGEHKVDFFVDGNAGINIKIKQEQSEAISAIPNTVASDTRSFSKILEIGLYIFAIIITFVVVKFSSSWMPKVNEKLSSYPVLFGVQLILWSAALYSMFNSANSDGIAWGGLWLLIAYGIAVRYKLSSLLAKSWIVLRERKSAHYFVLFVVSLLLSLIFLISNMNETAEQFVALSFYSLVVGVAVEFYLFAKGVRGGNPPEN